MLLDLSLLATLLGWYLSSLIAFSTLVRVASLTLELLFTTRDTVTIDTPAFLATSFMLGIFVFLGVKQNVDQLSFSNLLFIILKVNGFSVR
jgi:hypothetical protein